MEAPLVRYAAKDRVPILAISHNTTILLSPPISLTLNPLKFLALNPKYSLRPLGFEPQQQALLLPLSVVRNITLILPLILTLILTLLLTPSLIGTALVPDRLPHEIYDFVIGVRRSRRRVIAHRLEEG